MPARRASCEPMIGRAVATGQRGIHHVEGFAGPHGGGQRREGPVGDGVAPRPGGVDGARPDEPRCRRGRAGTGTGRRPTPALTSWGMTRSAQASRPVSDCCASSVRLGEGPADLPHRWQHVEAAVGADLHQAAPGQRRGELDRLRAADAADVREDVEADGAADQRRAAGSTAAARRRAGRRNDGRPRPGWRPARRR